MPKALFTSWLLKIPQKLKLMLKTSKMGEMTKIRFTKTEGSPNILHLLVINKNYEHDSVT